MTPSSEGKCVCGHDKHNEPSDTLSSFTTCQTLNCPCTKFSLPIRDGNAEERTDKEAEWQKMCERFVGCSMLADEFANEPHEPESFGNYIQNILDQLSAKDTLIHTLREALEKQRYRLKEIDMAMQHSIKMACIIWKLATAEIEAALALKEKEGG